MVRSIFLALALFVLIMPSGNSQNPSGNHANKFEELGYLLPSPNTYRSMDGTPGPDYWQQKCDYKIKCRLDTDEKRLYGEEIITYQNNSPNTLRYLWLQLDENQHSIENDNQYFNPSSIKQTMSEDDLRRLETFKDKEKFGVNIEALTTTTGDSLRYTINQTMMRVELPQPLKPGENFTFNCKWNYFLVDRVDLYSLMVGSEATSLARGGYEYFPQDRNYLFTITQWYPRLCAYTDAEGWQNNQFTGRGEFALTFGDFEVEMTVPDDYIVGSTGECQNYQERLSKKQLERWEKAQTADEPIEIVTLEDATKNEVKLPSKDMVTWKYKASNVRDFAWTASRKYIWDAMPHLTEDGRTVMCMSYYPKEAYPIYRRYSTKAVAHTLDVYSRYSIPYPYPVAISVEGNSGMEYPMICFNPGRAEADGTYTEANKNAAISVIIHEVGHNYYPMIINSDERQWAWFDEGLCSFVQYIAEQEWDPNYVSWFGTANGIVPYMSLPKDQLEPIMTNSENIVDYFNNAYSKPAAGLNILRETIMGRELFDYAFAEFGRRWAFKHPTPADFFRTMEDASGIDLDWFWRGWFYTTDAVDVSLDTILYYRVDLKNDPQKREYTGQQPNPGPRDDITRLRNKEEGVEYAVEKDEELQDFYTGYQSWTTEDSVLEYKMNLYGDQYTKKEKKTQFGDKHFYELHFSNKGGLVMPVILEWTYEDGSTEIERIPVQIWRQNESAFTKVFVKSQPVKAVKLDPYNELPDIDRSNDQWPVKEVPSQFQVFKSHQSVPTQNPMQKAGKGKS